MDIKMTLRKIILSGSTFLMTLWMLQGCLPLALRLSPTLLPNFTYAIFEECDPELAKIAIPSNLKLLEGMLKSDPKNKQILSTLSMGFSGYGLLFIEDEDPGRASQFYLRARDYGIRALGQKGTTLKNPNAQMDGIQNTLKQISLEDITPLCWTTAAWISWINLNLDQPYAIAQLGFAQKCLERLIELDPDYYYGLPNILMGAMLASRPKLLGGDIQRAKTYFEAAMKMEEGHFLLAPYFYAKTYAVQAQDKVLFLKLLDEIKEGHDDTLNDACLINAVVQSKARRLKDMVDEFFF